MKQHRHSLRFVLCCAALALVAGSVRADLSRTEIREAQKELQTAIRDEHADGFLGPFELLLEIDDRKTVRYVVDAYTRIAKKLSTSVTWSDYYYLHGKCARAMGEVSGESALDEIDKLRASKRTDWRAKVLLLDAAAFSKKHDIEKVATDALRDDAFQVVRRALDYLKHTKKVSVIEAVVRRYVAIEEKGKGDKRELNRTAFAFQSALQFALHVDLPSAVDWRNYVSVRKDRADFFEPKHSGSARTGLTLFGAAVTGKNIAFVLDVSGSMMSTDPAPKGFGSPGGRKGRTKVAGQKPKGPPKSPEERRRITRAKKELSRVIRALPDDVQFNIISYSSDVYPWKKAMVKASKSNKKAATEYVDELRAEGITVTDMALEEAFADLQLDTIYLITDGAPTHIGSRGPGLPEDAEDIIEAIHVRTKELNFLRAVRIFSLGFKGAKEDFLQKLSRDHGGKYVGIE